MLKLSTYHFPVRDSYYTGLFKSLKHKLSGITHNILISEFFKNKNKSCNKFYTLDIVRIFIKLYKTYLTLYLNKHHI